MIREYTLTEKLWIWLSQTPGLGPRTFLRIISEAVDIENFFTNYKDILPGLKLNESIQRRLTPILEFPEYDKYIESLEKAGISAVCRLSPEYPELLKDVYSPPTVLYCRGDISCLTDRTIAMVGTRACLPDSTAAVKELAHELAESSVTVVSGMALGIDSAAHSGALLAGGKTVAVLAGGVDAIYPPENTGLYFRIIENGAVISENPPGFATRSGYFNARNRIIAGVSSCVYIGEAPFESGTSITARHAAENDRTVFVAEAAENDERFALANSLKSAGAKCVTSARDILCAMGWEGMRASRDDDIKAANCDTDISEALRKTIAASGKKPYEKAAESDPSQLPYKKNTSQKLDFLEQRIYNLLLKGQLDMESICADIGCNVGELAGRVTMLELKGVVKRLPGNLICLK